MRKFWRSLVRISSFIGKEMAEVLRQPRLILTLVLGPFLILLLFGIGYRNQARALRTLFVIQPGSPLAKQIEQYASSLGQQLVYTGQTGDQAQAEDQLRRGEVDVVVLAPPSPDQVIANNQQAVFTLEHNEIDPTQVDYVRYIGQVYIDEVNRRVLESSVQQGQERAGKIRGDVQAAHASTESLRQALAAGNQAAARQSQQQLSQQVSALAAAGAAGVGLVGAFGQSLGGGQGPGSGDLTSGITAIRRQTDALGNAGSAGGDLNARLQQVTKLKNDLAMLDKQLDQFQRLSPQVIVQPFRSQTQSVARVQPGISDFFAPSVIALLLQHMAVTFAALSIVRERRQGSMELFRVSPVSAIETLLGKYLSYLLFGGVLAAVLTALVVFGLRVPMLGDWWRYAGIVAALLFTSLGYGFVISLVSQSDSQAVQYSMIVLLASVFFSGFMLSLRGLWAPVRVISWALPATYGINLLQNIMLRGQLREQYLLAALVAIGAALFVMAGLLLRRTMARG